MNALQAAHLADYAMDKETLAVPKENNVAGGNLVRGVLADGQHIARKHAGNHAAPRHGQTQFPIGMKEFLGQVELCGVPVSLDGHKHEALRLLLVELTLRLRNANFAAGERHSFKDALVTESRLLVGFLLLFWFRVWLPLVICHLLQSEPPIVVPLA